ncbi:hypothetical protein REPUB_Repub05bG0164600 [Reevesia pubescens]
MKKTELIFIPAPGMGHLVSTLEFAKRLIHRDHRLSVTILSIKLPFSSFVDAYTNSVGGYIFALINNHIPFVKATVTDFLSSQSSSGSTQVAGSVLDFLCSPMVDIANELNLPSYIFLTSNAGYLGLLLHLINRHNRNSSEFKYSDPEHLIPGFINPVPPYVLPSPLFDKDSGYPSNIKVAQRLKYVKELEPYAIKYFSNGQNSPIYPVRLVLDIGYQPHPNLNMAQRDKVMKWLDDQPQSSVVFLCFGSFGATQVKKIALGLEHSGYMFLWSLRVPPAPPKNDA